LEVRKWKSFQLKSKFGVYGDPVMLIDNEGRNYYFHLSNYAQWLHGWIELCAKNQIRLKDLLMKERLPNPMAKVHDKHWVAYDPERKIIHMTWTQFDAYKSIILAILLLFCTVAQRIEATLGQFQYAFLIYAGDCLDGDNTVEGATPAVGPNGEVYVAWTGPQGIMFNVSYDYGLDLDGKERKVVDHPGGWDIDVPGIYRCNGLTYFECDRSDSPYRGNLYINWADQKHGENDTDMWVVRSSDGGKTWSEPTFG
jgi:hypothetical protein